MDCCDLLPVQLNPVGHVGVWVWKVGETDSYFLGMQNYRIQLQKHEATSECVLIQITSFWESLLLPTITYLAISGLLGLLDWSMEIDRLAYGLEAYLES